MGDCYLCGKPVHGEVASMYVPWEEHADRRICVANIRADERKRIAQEIRQQCDHDTELISAHVCHRCDRAARIASGGECDD